MNWRSPTTRLRSVRETLRRNRRRKRSSGRRPTLERHLLLRPPSRQPRSTRPSRSDSFRASAVNVAERRRRAARLGRQTSHASRSAHSSRSLLRQSRERPLRRHLPAHRRQLRLRGVPPGCRGHERMVSSASIREPDLRDPRGSAGAGKSHGRMDDPGSPMTLPLDALAQSAGSRNPGTGRQLRVRADGAGATVGFTCLRTPIRRNARPLRARDDARAPSQRTISAGPATGPGCPRNDAEDNRDRDRPSCSPSLPRRSSASSRSKSCPVPGSARPLKAAARTARSTSCRQRRSSWPSASPWPSTSCTSARGRVPPNAAPSSPRPAGRSPPSVPHLGRRK